MGCGKLLSGPKSNHRLQTLGLPFVTKGLPMWFEKIKVGNDNSNFSLINSEKNKVGNGNS